MTRSRIFALLAALSLNACVSQGRFRDEPIVWRVDDQKNIAEPEEAKFYRLASKADSFVTRRTTRLLELRSPDPARNTNALDEVPDSSWFTNRIGMRRISPVRAALGASKAGPPRLPLTVKGGKPGGANPGLLAKDADGRVFVIKFDTKENPEQQTSINNIVNRIFWTLGYNVPNDTILRFKREDVTVDPKAVAKNELGEKRPMTVADVDSLLKLAPRFADRSFRATASEFIEGVPKGGWPLEGTRKDDPNDVVDHEYRRELRGLGVFAAWLNHTDMKQDNSHDTYVEENGKHFLRHYLVDFGEAFGGQAAEAGRPETGHEHFFDWSIQSRALVSFGLWVRPWEGLQETKWPSVGRFTAENFDPEKWREMFPYWPFEDADPADKYWAAKLIMRFTRPMLKEMVKTGELTQPAAADYLLETIWERARIVGRKYLEAVSPLDNFSISSGELCMDDLSVRHGLVTSGLVEALGEHDEVVFDNLVDKHGHLCIPIKPEEKYQYYRLRVRRRDEVKPAMQVHFKGGKRARLLGVIRTEM